MADRVPGSREKRTTEQIILAGILPLASCGLGQICFLWQCDSTDGTNVGSGWPSFVSINGTVLPIEHVVLVGLAWLHLIRKDPMTTLEIVLLSTLLVVPIVDLVLEQYRFKSRIMEYFKISFLLWVVTAFLVYAFSVGALGVSAPSYISSSTWQNMTAVLISLALVVYMAYSALSISRNSEVRAQVLSAIQSGSDSMNELLPATRKEYLIFVLIVSVSAGICEELIFRWYLLDLLELRANWMVACVVSSLAFGLWHLYLGWRHVVKSAVIGLLLSLLYLYFESILFVIFLHVFMDMHAGTVAFVARKPVNGIG